MAGVYTHGGSAGDVIYALPAVRDAGGGELWLNRNAHHHWRMPPDRIESLLTLIAAQPYITACGMTDHVKGTDLDRWRRHWRGGYNLADMVSAMLGVPHTSRTEPWLRVPTPRRVAPVVFHRSPRYHVQAFPWDTVVETYGRDAVFVGEQWEHADFCQRFGPVSYWRTGSYLELAEVIAGADLFVGNQSSPAAVAQGLRQNMVQETVDRHNWAWNCHWDRPGMWHDATALPALDSLRPPARAARLPGLVPLRPFEPADAAEALRHLADDWLYAPGNHRFICALLGVLHQEIVPVRPDLGGLLLECVWMARRMNDHGRRQEELDWTTP